MLLHSESKSARVAINGYTAAGKRVSDGVLQRRVVADLTDRLQGCSQVGAIIAEYGSACADLRQARRGVSIGAEMVVKTPGANRFPKTQYLGRISRVRDPRHHAV